MLINVSCGIFLIILQMLLFAWWLNIKVYIDTPLICACCNDWESLQLKLIYIIHINV